MNFYRQTIILFGVVLPVILAVGLVLAGYLLHSKMKNSFTLKERMYLDNMKAREQINMIEENVKADRVHLERWNKQLAEETASAVAINLKEISDKLPNKEIQQTAFNPSSNAGGFGTASAQSASTIRIGFRGTFRTLQKAFLELETRMPQLQLEALSIKPANNSSYLLTIQVTYTAWQQ